MGTILKEPDTPLIAFFKGAGGTALAVGFPVLIRVLFFPRDGSDGFWTRVWIGGAIVSTLCLVAGVVCAIWALVQRRAYDRVTGDPFH